MSAAWVAAIAAVLAALAAAQPLRWMFRLLIGTHEFLVEWPKMRAAITGLQAEVAEIKAETRPDGGNSLRDVVHRTADDVAGIKDEQARLRAQLEQRTLPPEGR